MPSSSIADEPRAVHIDIPVTTRERHWGRLTTWLPAAVVFVVCLVVAMHVVVSARSRAREDVLDDLIHLAGDKMASHVAMTNERMNMIPSLAHVFMDRVNRTHTPLPQKGVDTAVEHFMGEKSDVTIECLCFSVSMRVTDAERADFETHSWRPISQPLPQDPNVAPNASNVVGDPYPEHALPVYYPIVTTYPASYSWAKFVDDRNRSAVRAAAVNKTLHTLDTAVGTLGQTPRGLAYSFVQAIPTSAADRTHDGYISFKITVDSLWQKFSVDGWVMTETLVDQTIGAVLMDHLPQDYGDTHVQVALWHIQLLSHDWVYTIYVAEELLQQKADEASNFVPQLIMGIGCSMLAGFVVAFATVEFRRWQTMNADSIRHTASTAAHEEMLRLMNHELRNPLTALSSGLDITWSTVKHAPPQASIGTVQKECEHEFRRMTRGVSIMQRALDDLLDVALVQRGDFVLHPSEFDILWLVRDTQHVLVSRLDGSRGVRVGIHPSVPPRLVGDRTRIRHLIAELASSCQCFTTGLDVEICLQLRPHPAGTGVMLMVSLLKLDLPHHFMRTAFAKKVTTEMDVWLQGLCFEPCKCVDDVRAVGYKKGERCAVVPASESRTSSSRPSRSMSSTISMDVPAPFSSISMVHCRLIVEAMGGCIGTVTPEDTCKCEPGDKSTSGAQSTVLVMGIPCMPAEAASSDSGATEDSVNSVTGSPQQHQQQPQPQPQPQQLQQTLEVQHQTLPAPSESKSQSQSQPQSHGDFSASGQVDNVEEAHVFEVQGAPSEGVPSDDTSSTPGGVTSNDVDVQMSDSTQTPDTITDDEVAVHATSPNISAVQTLRAEETEKPAAPPLSLQRSLSHIPEGEYKSERSTRSANGHVMATPTSQASYHAAQRIRRRKRRRRRHGRQVSVPNPDQHHVVVVDDEALIRRCVESQLRHLGVEDVTYLVDGDELDSHLRVRPTPPTCVLLDIVMQRSNGVSVLRQLRQQPLWAELPVYAMTSNVEKEDQYMKAGFSGLLGKPFVRGDVAAVLEHSLLAEPTRGFLYRHV